MHQQYRSLPLPQAGARHGYRTAAALPVLQPQQRQRRPRRRCASPAPRLATAAASNNNNSDVTADVVVVGTGIVGLCVAHALLERTRLSVALVDRQQPCAGATGAGQGYIWMAHRSPDTPLWDLAVRSRAAWRRFVAANPELARAVEWQETGSMLLAATPAEMSALAARAEMLASHGVRGARLLPRDAVLREEPSLGGLPADAAGLLVENDAQISGRAAAFALLDECERIGAVGGRCTVLLHEAATALEPAQTSVGTSGTSGSNTSFADSGGVVVVTETGRRVTARAGAVVAAGVWSGELLARASGDARWRSLLAPRRGHLLELARPAAMPPLRRGVMEVAYASHYAPPDAAHGGEQAAAALAQGASQLLEPDQRSGVVGSGGGGGANSSSSSSGSDSDDGGGGGGAHVEVTFTATTSSSGTLLVGSSREFGGWQAAPRAHVMRAIMERAHEFMPDLHPSLLLDALDARGGGGATSGSTSGSVGGTSGSGGGGKPGGAAAASVRVGLRPYALGGLPAIGPVPGLPGVFVAAGHEGSGLSLAPATADLVLQQLGVGTGSGVGASKDALGALDDLLPEARLAAARALAGGAAGV